MWSKLSANPAIHALIIYLLIISVALAIGTLFGPVLLPLLVSSILYVILKPMVFALESRGVGSSPAVSLVIAALLIASIGSVIVLYPLLIDQFQELQERLPHIEQKISGFIKESDAILNKLTNMTLNAESVLEASMKYFDDTGANLVISSAGIMMQFFMALLLIPLITFFLLRDFRLMRNRVMSWLPNYGFELGWLIYHAVAHQLQDYLRGILMQSTIIAIIASVGFYLIGVDMFLLFGVMTGILNLIPYLGPLLAIIPPLIVSLGSESIPMLTIIGIPIVVFSAQLIDNLFVVPTLIAKTVNLHPLIVLLGIIIFGAFFGFIGMLIAIPIMAISKIIFTSLFYGLNKRESIQPI